MPSTMPRTTALRTALTLYLSFEPAAHAAGQNEPLAIAVDWIHPNQAARGLEPLDVADLVVSDHYTSRDVSIDHIWLQQQVDGIAIEGALIGLHLRGGRVFHVGDSLERGLAERLGPKSVTLSPDQALGEAVRHLGLGPLDRTTAFEVERLGGPRVRARFAGGTLSAREIPVDLAWVAGPDGGPIRLAWRVEIDRQQVEHRWPVVYVDANTGVELQRSELVADGGAEGAAEAVAVASYRVYPFPFESPTHGATHSVVEDPWDLVASPFGWHDTNGVAGPDSQDTTGNNVEVRDDLDSNNLGGSTVDGGVSREFDFAHNHDVDPVTGGDNLEAAVVNLFYWNNIVHDVLYRVGFDEAAGNFQLSNYGNGGLAGDRVDAQALDGASLIPPNTNNANFGTPADGTAPRMQMFRWTAAPTLTTSVGNFAPGAPGSGWGAGAYPVSTTSGTIVLVDDGVTASGSTTADGCSSPFVNAGAVSGQIALIERGRCEFGLKALNAQANGAIGVIIHNSAAGGDSIATMSPGAGVPPAGLNVNIPTIALGFGDGMTIRASLPGVTGSFAPGVADRDSDFDAGLIAHEYGHGWTNRLTGGPSQASCLQNQEQAGEGWSDILAMILTMEGAASCATPRGVVTYSSGQPEGGRGIRRFRYTRDMAVNPFTYAFTNDTVNQSVPHGVGSVWATAVWDLTCDLVDDYGFGSLVSPTSGNGLALRLISDGLKLQPCSPGMIDARNAILAADLPWTGGANTCQIWRSFARRGFGATASQGSSASRTDQVENFSVPDYCVAGNEIFNDGFELGNSTRWTATVL